jgi:electron transfer DM13
MSIHCSYTAGPAPVPGTATGRRWHRFLHSPRGHPDAGHHRCRGDGPEQAFDDDYLDLGRLQGNIGSQNYELPSDADLTRYRSVVIWCDRFNSAFGAAPLA